MTRMTPAARSGRRPRGTVSIAAVMLLAVVAIGLMGMTQLLGSDARRTRDARVQAQMRQLLLAGAAATPHWLDRRPASERELTLEPPNHETLANATLRLQLLSQDGDDAQVLVETTLDDRTMRQRVTWRRQDQVWRLSAARIERLR